MEKKKTIFVVEDNDLNMKLLRSLLKIDGYQIIEAQTAEAGLELAEYPARKEGKNRISCTSESRGL